jgi:outer membrane protein OmpA-like peptidoglycan-associated protein
MFWTEFHLMEGTAIMATLLDDLGQFASPALLSGAASTIGESEQNVARGMQGGMTALLAGLANKTGDATTMQQVFSFATDPSNDGKVLDNPAGLIDSIAGGARSPIVGLGERFTSSIFGGRSAAVNDVISRFSGLRPGAIASIIRLAAPLVLGLIGRRIRDGGLDVGGLGNLLNNEKGDILRAAPPGLSEALRPEREVPLRGERVRETYASEPRARERTVPPPEEAHKTGGRKIWPVVAALVAFGLIWASWPRRDRRVADVDVVPQPNVVGATAVAGGEVTPAPLTSRLPNGENLNLREDGMESRLLVFIRDPAQPTNDSTWFEFDRLTFEENSANLRPESEEQLRNVALILKSYPNVNVKIGGYTDSVGVESANQRLSQQRANSVRAVLIKQGVTNGRVSATGYGEKHPVADNSTEEGRTRNRRIALLVTKK